MQLHRTHKKPDWALVTPTDRTWLQRVAAATRGVVTPGNLFTIGGLALVVYGALHIYWRHYWLGIVIIMVGRLCDLADGWLAERTATKSPLGEALDAISDKLAVLVGVVALLLAHIAPWWLLVALLMPHILMTAVTTLTFVSTHHVIHPSKIGKLSMAASWFCLGALPVLQALDIHGVVRNSVYAVSLICVGVYVITVGQYVVSELNRA